LHNQPERIQQIYFSTKAQIQTRSLPAKALAARVRLRKTPEQYQNSRQTMREAAYEAMLAARRTWTRGQRIRLYKKPQGYGILPADEDNSMLEFATDYDTVHYLALLERVYAKKIEHAASPEQLARLFSSQQNLFAAPLELKWLASALP
jgi:DNA polymerase, archaea type